MQITTSKAIGFNTFIICMYLPTTDKLQQQKYRSDILCNIIINVMIKPLRHKYKLTAKEFPSSLLQFSRLVDRGPWKTIKM